jgi:hypothetical protein
MARKLPPNVVDLGVFRAKKLAPPPAVVSFLPLQFRPEAVARVDDLVEFVIDDEEGVGIVLDLFDALALAKALKKAALSSRKRGKYAHPRGNVARGKHPKRR